MNVESATITMPAAAACEAYRAYREEIRQGRATPEDVQLYRGYRALMRGRQLLDVHRAIGTAGRDERGRPRLAIGRADYPWLLCSGEGFGTNDNATYRFVPRRNIRAWPRGRSATSIDIPRRAFTDIVPGRANDPSCMQRGFAAVPGIPPQFRPRGDLGDYAILWEASWEDAPTDPFLLKHLDGPLYVILAAWDLTPLEQSVLRRRA